MLKCKTDCFSLYTDFNIMTIKNIIEGSSNVIETKTFSKLFKHNLILILGVK